MYKLIEAEDTIRIHPSKFGEPLEKIALEELKDRYEGTVVANLGLIVSILKVQVSEVGRILPRDPSTHHKVRFKALVFQPLLHEIVKGEVIMIEDIGVFVRLGPVDGFIHKSQIADNELFTYDRHQSIAIGENTRRVLAKGDIVRARIVQVSTESMQTRGLRIGLTMRQPFLGKLEWIEEKKKKK